MDGTRRSRPRLGLIPPRWRSHNPPRWWQEIVFVLVVYGLYTLTRDALPTHETAALHRAHDILSFEQSIHIDPEHALNHFLAMTEWLAQVSDYYYAALHFVITIGVLVWIYVKHPSRYRALRGVLMATTLLALIGFYFYPLAPPRFLPGYVDTVSVFHTWGSVASPTVANEANQYAAMPSLHIGWAMWASLSMVAVSRRTWVRVLWAIYPLFTLFVILGTANHFVVDAAAGAVTLFLGTLVQRFWCGRRAFHEDPPEVDASGPSGPARSSELIKA